MANYVFKVEGDEEPPIYGVLQTSSMTFFPETFSDRGEAALFAQLIRDELLIPGRNPDCAERDLALDIHTFAALVVGGGSLEEKMDNMRRTDEDGDSVPMKWEDAVYEYCGRFREWRRERAAASGGDTCPF